MSDKEITEEALTTRVPAPAPTPEPRRFDTFLAVDLEHNQPSGRIIQVGVVVATRGTPENHWIQKSWLLDPLEQLSPSITDLTGITEDNIAQHAVSWAQMTQDLSDLLDVNKPFINPVSWGEDSATLKNAILAQGLEFKHFGRRWLDVKTMHSMGALALGKNPSGGLRSVMGRHGIQFKGLQHRADVDAFNTLRLFFHLLQRTQTVEELLQSVKAVRVLGGTTAEQG